MTLDADWLGIKFVENDTFWRKKVLFSFIIVTYYEKLQIQNHVDFGV